MIAKSFEIEKTLNNNLFLFYGENFGLQKELIDTNFKSRFKDNCFRYNEKEILNNLDNFYNNLYSNSFFEKEKLIIIDNVSDKIYSIINEILEKNLEDIKIILSTGLLDKKSKIRKLFEKEKNFVCIPCYKDNFLTLATIVKKIFKENNILSSQEIINVIVEKSSGDRKNLQNELEKIKFYMKNKKNINYDEVVKLINLAENHNISELIDNCLAKNKRKTISILNDNIINQEDNILLVKTFLYKLKRLKKLKIKMSINNNIDLAISEHKPPIFWKEKDLIKQQLKIWSTPEIIKLIDNVNSLELLIKTKFQISNQIVNNFILEKLESTNN